MKIRHMTEARDFVATRRIGEKVSCETISIYTLKRSSPEGLSVGCTVAKRLAHKAVTRNLIKRLTYAHFRENSTGGENANVVVVLENKVDLFSRKMLSAKIRQELKKLTIKAKLNPFAAPTVRSSRLRRACLWQVERKQKERGSGPIGDTPRDKARGNR